jgi:hypothetical protein
MIKPRNHTTHGAALLLNKRGKINYLEEHSMKKILALALVMVLALSLFTACGGGNDNGGNGGDNSNPTNNNGGSSNPTDNPGNNSNEPTSGDGWPSSLLPSSLPEYTEGEISYSVNDKGKISIVIKEPTTDNIVAYFNALLEDGWNGTLHQPGLIGICKKGDWEFEYGVDRESGQIEIDVEKW